MQFHRLAVASAVVASLALAGCGGRGGPRAPQPLNVDVTAAQRSDIATYLNLDGQIAPLEQSTLSFQQPGPISRIDVNIGDVVQAGQLLAQIDPSTLQAQYEQALATANGARLGLPVSIQNNAASLQTAKAALENAKLVYDQNEQLYKQGYVSQSQMAGARAQYVQAQSQYNIATSNVGGNGVTQENVKAALAQANVLRTELSQTSLYAPYEGVITARSMDPGAMAGPSSPVLSIARIDAVWVNVNVPDGDLAYTHAGAPVTFTTPSLPSKKFTGKIDNLNAVPTQGTLSYLARLRQPNPSGLLRGGMLVNVTILKQRANDAILVPRDAIAQSDNGNSVYIVATGKSGSIAKQVSVKVGLQTDTMSQVTSDQITAGTQVITTRPDALQNNSPIAINGAPSPSSSPSPSASPSGK